MPAVAGKRGRPPKTTTPQPALVLQAAEDNPHAENTPEYYLHEISRVKAKVRLGHVNALDGTREMDFWAECAKRDGLDLRAAALANLDPLRQLLANPELVEHNEKALREIRRAMETAEALTPAEVYVKKKWVSAIDLAMKLQRKAMSKPILFAVYVVRCQETNDVLTMEQLHADIFHAWADPDAPNSLIEAHPGTGKTTCTYGQILWDFKDDQRLRTLFMSADEKTACNRLDVVRTYINSGRYRALAPHVRIDPGKPNNTEEFTLVRENVGSQDPSMRAAGATGTIQGAGYDREYFDDLCDIKVRREPSTREKIDQNFHGVALRRRRNFRTSRVRYICTPWHPDDVAGRIVRLCREGKLRGWRIDRYPVKEDADGDPIPSVTRPGLAAELASLKSSNPVIYACCYKLDPVSKTLRTLKQLVYYDVSGGQSKLCPPAKREYWRGILTAIQSGERWQVVDPAAGGRDETASVCFSLSANGRAAVLGADFWGFGRSDSLERIAQNVKDNGADKVLLENQGGMKGLADIGGEYLLARLGPAYASRIFFSGTRLRDASGRAVGQNIRKSDRFANASSYLNNGVILFPGEWIRNGADAELTCCGDANLRKLHEELMEYPNVIQDGGIDAVSMFINYHLTRLVRDVPSLKKPEEAQEADAPINVLVHWRMQMDKKARHTEPPAGTREAERRFFASVA